MTHPNNCPCQGPDRPDAAHGWHTRTGPGPLLAQRHGITTPHAYPAPWVDHHYRLRAPDGTWSYIAEPYSLGPAALADLAWLAEQGWNVVVTARGARHLPGGTVAVTITQDPRKTA